MTDKTIFQFNPAKNPFLGNLPAEAMEELMNLGKVQRLSDGEPFIREGDPKKQLEIAEKVQTRIISEGVTVPLGQFQIPMARRKTVSGNVESPVTVFWNIEKK